MRSEFTGNIVSIRAVEDCIRATRKYTEGVGTRKKMHPVQGDDFPSCVFCKYYEVYPDTEIHWDMPASVAIDWLWRDTTCIDVLFKYDYRTNKASVSVKDGEGAVSKLRQSMPGFGTALEKVISNNGHKEA